ncbi:Sigma-70, region 4 [Paenibacillus sp. OK060]|nr:Sigma-70, region 4 [Paenibacillus sp. OK060]
MYDCNSIESFEGHSISKFYVQDILNLISTDIGRKIIRSIYIEGKSEKEIALELNISQQAVNKWKRKSLKLISAKLTS